MGETVSALKLARHREDGSTLVEAMVAFAILAIVLVASAYAMISALQVQTRTESRDKAVQLVQQQLEKARQVPFSQLGFRPYTPSPSGNADPGLVDKPVLGAAGHELSPASSTCTDLSRRLNCTVLIPELEEYEPEGDYQTERLVPWRELLFDEPGGVGGVDYVIRTNISYVDPSELGTPGNHTPPIAQDHLAKRVTVTVYWTETTKDVPKILSTSMTILRTPNPGEWKS